MEVWIPQKGFKEYTLVRRAGIWVYLLHFTNMREKREILPGNVCK